MGQVCKTCKLPPGMLDKVNRSLVEGRVPLTVIVSGPPPEVHGARHVPRDQSVPRAVHGNAVDGLVTRVTETLAPDVLWRLRRCGESGASKRNTKYNQSKHG